MSKLKHDNFEMQNGELKNSVVSQMGYGEVSQSGAGIHLRQYSRAFIFQKGDTRIVLVTADILAVGIAVRRQVGLITLTV